MLSDSYMLCVCILNNVEVAVRYKQSGYLEEKSRIIVVYSSFREALFSFVFLARNMVDAVLQHSTDVNECIIVSRNEIKIVNKFLNAKLITLKREKNLIHLVDKKLI